MAPPKDLPVLDFTKVHSSLDSFSKEIYQASNEWGFFVLTGHGIQGTDQMFELSKEFFDLPLEQKAEKVMDEKVVGYDGKAKTTFAASEGMSFGTTPSGILETDNLPAWSDRPRREAIESFKAECYELSIAILCCFAIQLGFPKDFFLNTHQHRDPGNNLKFIKYPKMGQHGGQPVPRLSEHTDWGSITFVFAKQAGIETRDPANECLPYYQGIGAHTDFGAITILLQDMVGGLQVWDRTASSWTDVEPEEGALVVNLGNLMVRWANGQYLSSIHRIINKTGRERYSVPFFYDGNPDFLVSCFENCEDARLGAKYPPIKVSDWIMGDMPILMAQTRARLWESCRQRKLLWL